MKHFVTINPAGQFELDSKRWYCNSVVYFGHHPGNMEDWLADPWWAHNAQRLDGDLEMMNRLGLNHLAMFFKPGAFFDNGRILAQGMDRLDHVVQTVKGHGLRMSIFIGDMIDTPEIYRQITGQTWEDDNRFLPAFNPNVFAAYVQQIRPFAERYRDEPAVMAYTDRIDRFYKGFDNVTIPFNLKEEWAEHLRRKFGRLEALREAMGGSLEGDPREFIEVLLPQESKFNASLKNPLGYEYILWQKQSIGDTHARFDAEVNKIAPHQFIWTPFEGNTNTWAMIDGFSPKTRKLQAIWMEYYYFENTRPSHVQEFYEWAHTPELIHRRLAHELPVVHNAAYMMARYLKLSCRQPVVICHGSSWDTRAYGQETLVHQVAGYDRVNAACLNADADGWHYWSWCDDYSSMQSFLAEQTDDPTAVYLNERSKGLVDYQGRPRPLTALVRQYSTTLANRLARGAAERHSEALLLSSAPRMYNLFRRLAYPTAAAVCGALQRCGVMPDYLWTAQDEVRLDEETLARYRLIVLADNLYERDFRDMPEKLLRWVEAGGTLVFAMDRWQTFRDEHGVDFDCPALTRLTGIDPAGKRDWPHADDPCRNWPYGEKPVAPEPGLNQDCFNRCSWGICEPFRHYAPQPWRAQFLGFRITDGDTLFRVPALTGAAETIAVAKFPHGTHPLYWRHPVGKGMVYVSAWTMNVFRDSEDRNDYGGWEYDWMLSLPIETSGIAEADLTAGPGLWLRNTWGYFWKEM